MIKQRYIDTLRDDLQMCWDYWPGENPVEFCDLIVQKLNEIFENEKNPVKIHVTDEGSE